MGVVAKHVFRVLKITISFNERDLLIIDTWCLFDKEENYFFYSIFFYGDL